MSIIAIRQSNRHWPVPIWEAVALRCKNPIAGSPPQREITGILFKTSKPNHQGDVIARQVGLIVMSNGSAIIQIPIDRCLLIAHR